MIAGQVIHMNAFPKSTGLTGKDITITLTDLTGRQLRADRPGGMAGGHDAFLVDITGVQPGIYLVTVSTAATKTLTRVTISREA
jgi:hypothetical protein